MSIFSIKNLDVTFANGESKNIVLNNLSFTIDSCSLLAICGKSGCGKSTLLNVLLGIEKPTNGKVEYLGQNIFDFKEKQKCKYRSSIISVVFQHYNLFNNLTSLENVIVPLLIKGVNKAKAIKEAKVLFNEFSLTYLIDQKVDTLSGGEKQRVAIIRALITNPKVILADEPTGALDEKNSRIIMGMFKEISKKKTVVLVSHNLELVYEFADRIIYLKNGVIEKDETINKNPLSPPIKQINKYRREKITNFLNFKFLKDKLKRNFVVCIAIFVGLLINFLSIGFKYGSTISNEKMISKNLERYNATVSLKSYQDIPNSYLKLEKNVKPKIDDVHSILNGFSNYEIHNNYSYAFSSYPTVKYQNRELTSYELIPFYNSFDSIKIFSSKGEFTNAFNEVIVNEQFASLIDEPLNALIKVSSEATFTKETGDSINPFVKDIFSYNLEFKIVGIVKEFSFLNTPKIYYSGVLLENFLSSSILENISSLANENVSVKQYIDEAKSDELISSYNYRITFKSDEEVNKFYEILNRQDDSMNLVFESKAYEVNKTYSQFISSFSDAILIFSIISFLAVNFIIGMVCLSNYVENKKNNAILKCFGMRNSDILKMYVKQNSVLVFVSFLFSFFFSYFSQIGINFLINYFFGIENLIEIPFLSLFNIPFLLPISILCISLLFSFLFVVIPLSFYSKTSISYELRDE